MAHPYDTSYDAPPPIKTNKINILFFRLLMILGRQKIHSPGALVRRGGAPVRKLATPRRTDGLWSFWHRSGGPCKGDERPIRRAKVLRQGGTGWGGSGKEGKNIAPHKP